MKTPKQIFKSPILPLLAFDIVVLMIVLADPISFYLEYSGEFSNSERILSVFSFIALISFPYFVFWTFIYLLYGWIYLKIHKEDLEFIFSSLSIPLKILMGFVIYSFLQLAKT